MKTDKRDKDADLDGVTIANEVWMGTHHPSDARPCEILQTCSDGVPGAYDGHE